MNSAIIGCGRIFPSHAGALMNMTDTRLLCVADCIKERAAAAAERYQCAHTADYHRVLEDPEIQVVHICTPHYLHREMALDALRSGKHVLLEKPVAMTRREALEIGQAAVEAGRQVGVCFQNRYNDATQTARKILASGELGPILGGRVFFTWARGRAYYEGDAWRGTWAQEGGGLLINQAIHTLDLAQWLCGGAAWLEASVHTRHLGGTIEVEDTAEGVIGMKGGATVVFYATNGYLQDAAPLIELYCAKGTVRMEEDVRVSYHNGGVAGYAGAAQPTAPNAGWGESHERLIRHFYRCLAGSEPFPIQCEEASRALWMVEACYRSSRENDRIPL